MDDKNAIREVIVALGSVAHVLRQHADPGLAEAAQRLDDIVRRMKTFRGDVPNTDECRMPGADLVSDTLLMLESFRQIESPIVRRAVISMVRALRPEEAD